MNTRFSLMQLRNLTTALLLIGLSASAWADSITLNFKDADINTVIETVSETTGKNFIVDPRVKGKVTVISAQPMDSSGLYQTFLSILEVHGFAAIPFGDTTKIVPQNDAKQLGRQFDSESYSDDLVTRAIAIQHVAAAQLVPILRPLLPQYGHLAAYAPSNILIISDRQANVGRILDLVRRIDRPGDAEVDVITLQFANATEVVKMLQSLDKASGQKNTAESVSYIADPRTNAVLVSGDRADRIRASELIKHLDTPSESNGNTAVVYLSYAKSVDLAKVLQGYAKATQQSDGKSGGSNNDVTILADEATNSLIITAPPRIGKELRTVIDRLDIRRAQVLVEAIIAEISMDKAFQLGFNYAGISNAGGFILEAGGLSTGAIAGAIGGDSSAIAGAIGSLPGATFGGASIKNGDIEFLGLLRAVSTDADNNVISTPSLLAMDNQEAEISIGQEVPFITGQFSGTGGDSNSVNPFTTIERKDVGVTLKITPHVIDNGTVELKIYQEVSGIAAGSAGSAADVITNKRTIDTTVIVDNGEIIALGGLLEDNTTDSRTKIPFLGDIPLIGGLFRSKNTKRTKRNLMVFIRPIILQDGKDLRRYSADRYKLLQKMQLSKEAIRGGVLPPLPGNPGPQIPEKRQQTDVIPMYQPPEDRQYEVRNPAHRVGPRR